MSHFLPPLRALVAHAIPTLTWRHHGIGCLQAYLVENANPEIRVHVWDPRLVRPGIRESGDIHDHRFHLVSTVIEGEIREKVFETVADPEGDWYAFFVENARSAGAERKFDGDCYVVPDGDRYFCGVVPRRHETGSQYALERGIFHRTEVDSLAVTVCQMYNKKGSARLLVPYGQEPVHAFGDPASPELQQQILSDAVQALRR